MRRIPEEWDVVELGAISRIRAGGTPRRNIAKYWKGGIIPWVKISDINSKYISKTEESITYAGLENSSSRIFSKGTILISIFATIGEVGILEIDSSCNQALAGIEVNHGKVEIEYLYYYLKNLRDTLRTMGRGVAQNNINQTILKNIKIPLPPLETQRKIVAILEKAESLKRLRAEANELTQKLIQSVFLEMFGDPVNNPKKWSSMKIEGILEKTQYGTSEKASNITSGHPCLGMNNVTRFGELNLIKINRIDLDEKEYLKYRLKPGDVLFNRTNAPNLVGKTGIIGDEEGYVFASYLIRLVPNGDYITSDYLWAILNSMNMKKLFFNISKKAINQANISATVLKKISIPIPPIELQKGFTKILKQIYSSYPNHDRISNNIETLTESLLQAAFIGELTS